MQMVSEVMTRNVQFISPQETVQRAAQMMDDLNVGALPVCEGDRLVGMVTDRDITVRATSAGMAPDEAVVDQVMSTDVRWCFEDQPLDEVMRQMADTQIRRVPVVSHDDAHRLIGIVSLGDVATKSADTGKQDVERIMKKVSYPAEPDLSSRGGTSGDGANEAGEVRASDTGTASGMAGSDLLADTMTPGIEISSTGDPSDMVEVTPSDLVNKNAPGSTSLNPDSPAERLKGHEGEETTVLHRNVDTRDTTTGGVGAQDGISAAGASGASGGTAGTSGSPGTGIGAKP
ncbi:CBS domain-containing protein [Noviherbaspirillum sp.]|uniref:CBS domain-containing protein n=1 Tax=Noviherbaspirillum sp. TaxID=1926288 RepID=UPI002FE2E10B